MQSQFPVVIDHPSTERWMLHISAFGIFVAVGWLISKVAPSVDGIIVTLLATFVAFLVWLILDHWITWFSRYNGSCLARNNRSNLFASFL